MPMRRRAARSTCDLPLADGLKKMVPCVTREGEAEKLCDIRVLTVVRPSRDNNEGPWGLCCGQNVYVVPSARAVVAERQRQLGLVDDLERLSESGMRTQRVESESTGDGDVGERVGWQGGAPRFRSTNEMPEVAIGLIERGLVGDGGLIVSNMALLDRGSCRRGGI
jgi:hypothetical protein